MLPTLSGASVAEPRWTIESEYSVPNVMANRPELHLIIALRLAHRLADAMFGDESDEDAKDVKKEYTFKPKKKKARSRGGESSDDDDSNESEDNDSDNEEKPRKKKANGKKKGNLKEG